MYVSVVIRTPPAVPLPRIRKIRLSPQRYIEKSHTNLTCFVGGRQGDGPRLMSGGVLAEYLAEPVRDGVYLPLLAEPDVEPDDLRV